MFKMYGINMHIVMADSFDCSYVWRLRKLIIRFCVVVNADCAKLVLLFCRVSSNKFLDKYFIFFLISLIFHFDWKREFYWFLISRNHKTFKRPLNIEAAAGCWLESKVGWFVLFRAQYESIAVKRAIFVFLD